MDSSNDVTLQHDATFPSRHMHTLKKAGQGYACLNSLIFSSSNAAVLTSLLLIHIYMVFSEI